MTKIYYRWPPMYSLFEKSICISDISPQNTSERHGMPGTLIPSLLEKI